MVAFPGASIRNPLQIKRQRCQQTLENAKAALNKSLKLIKLLGAKGQINDGEMERIDNLVDEFDMHIRKNNWIEFLPKEECLIEIENYYNKFVASNTK